MNGLNRTTNVRCKDEILHSQSAGPHCFSYSSGAGAAAPDDLPGE